MHSPSPFIPLPPLFSPGSLHSIDSCFASTFIFIHFSFFFLMPVFVHWFGLPNKETLLQSPAGHCFFCFFCCLFHRLLVHSASFSFAFVWLQLLHFKSAYFKRWSAVSLSTLPTCSPDPSDSIANSKHTLPSSFPFVLDLGAAARVCSRLDSNLHWICRKSAFALRSMVLYSVASCSRSLLSDAQQQAVPRSSASYHLASPCFARISTFRAAFHFFSVLSSDFTAHSCSFLPISMQTSICSLSNDKNSKTWKFSWFHLLS